MPKEILLQLKDASVHYGGVKAIDGVDVAVKCKIDFRFSVVIR